MKVNPKDYNRCPSNPQGGHMTLDGGTRVASVCVPERRISDSSITFMLQLLRGGHVPVIVVDCSVKARTGGDMPRSAAVALYICGDRPLTVGRCAAGGGRGNFTLVYRLEIGEGFHPQCERPTGMAGQELSPATATFGVAFRLVDWASAHRLGGAGAFHPVGGGHG